MKREIDLTNYVSSIMAEAEKVSERDYLLMAVLGEGGFRRGEAVGNSDRREVWRVDQFIRPRKKAETDNRERIVAYLEANPTAIVDSENGEYRLVREGKCIQLLRTEDPLPGLMVKDLHDGAIWVRGKGQTEAQQPLPDWLYNRLKQYIGDRETGKVFDVSDDYLYHICHKYAKLAGVPDWKLAHPHRWRHAYCQTLRINNVPLDKRQALMRHKSPDMTRHYDGEFTLDEKRAAIQGVWK